MDLGGGKTDSALVAHGVQHIGHEPADFRGSGVCDRVRQAAQDRMAHAGDFENGHKGQYGAGSAPRKGRVRRNALGPPRFTKPRACARSAACSGRVSPERTPDSTLFSNPFVQEEWDHLQVIVRDNNVDQALRALKKKMQREGIFREMKMRRNYEKPSEKRARERAESVRRHRKMLRKRMEREGF
jgi:small subunit ribosomal protein S21